jgi:hypothetical protein
MGKWRFIPWRNSGQSRQNEGCITFLNVDSFRFHLPRQDSMAPGQSHWLLSMDSWICLASVTLNPHWAVSWQSPEDCLILIMGRQSGWYGSKGAVAWDCAPSLDPPEKPSSHQGTESEWSILLLPRVPVLGEGQVRCLWLTPTSPWF